MKKFIAIITLVTMLSGVSCSSKTPADSTPGTEAATSAAESSSADSSTEESVEETEAEAETNALTGEEKDTANWWGLKMYCPDEYSSDSMRGFNQYYVLDGTENVKNMVFYTYAHSEVDTMDAEAVRQLMYDDYAIENCGLSAEYNGEIIEENEIQKEEKVTVNGSECIRQEGILHCNDYIEPHDYFYVAYFGVLDFPMLGKQPAMLIAFTHRLDDDSKAAVVHDIDTAAQNAAPIE